MRNLRENLAKLQMCNKALPFYKFSALQMEREQENHASYFQHNQLAAELQIDLPEYQQH